MANEKTHNTENDIFNMFDLLGELFSHNYSCLRIANQDTPIGASSSVVNADELFRSKPKTKTVWIDGKLADAAEERNETFDNVLTAWEIEKKQILGDIDISKQIAAKRRTLMTFYNAYYGTKQTFKEAFDGFNALNPHFAALARDFDTKKVFSTDDPAVSRLMHAYFEYIELMKSVTAYLPFDQISAILKDDVTESGRPSIYFKKHGNSDVSSMTGEELESFVKDSEIVLKRVQDEVKAENKKLIPLYRDLKKKPFDYSLHDEISKIKSVIHNLLEKQKKAEHYNFFAKSLLERFIYANTDYDASRWHDFCEGLFDLTAGINIFKKENKLKFDDVYVHNLERSYLSYLKNMFQDSPALISEKTEIEQQRI